MVFRKNIISILVLTLISIWISIFSFNTSLHIIACDIGQGDAILIQNRQTQILIDGGPNKSVLDCLGRHMPFWDKEIELVILTHPQLDHYGGLIDVFKNYKVDKFGEYNRDSSNQSYQVLRNVSTDRITLTKGTEIRIGMIYLEILNPIGDIRNKNVNDDGVVTLLNYRGFKALFTADVENEVSDSLSVITKIQDIDYIKVNHHGSKNGLSQKLLDITNPKVAIISSGKNNSYGHPSIEILKMLNTHGVKIRRTDNEGDIDYVLNQ